MNKKSQIKFKKILIFSIVLISVLSLYFVIASFQENQTVNFNSNSFFISNPELRKYNVEIDNGLKISYGTNYSITFIPYFVLNNGNVLTWNEIPSNIQKDLWKIKIQDNYYKYGISFDNLTTSQKNSIKYVVLHRSNSSGLTWDDVQLDGNTIIIKNKIYLSHDDILSTYTIPIINKTDIVIGGLDRNWTECIEYNETEPFNCINETIKFNWILNGDGTWNISFDPTIFIAGGVTATINSPQNNSNFNVSSVTFNVTSNDTLSWCGVSINSSANVTMTNTSATAFNYTNSSIADGNYNFRITCNDTSNNYGNSGLNYFLVDTVIPTLNVTSPVNSSTYNSSSVLFNVSSSEEGSGSIIPDIDNSLVSWWRMDDTNGSANSVSDYLGRNNGTAQGNAAQTNAGKLGKGFEFDGAGDYVLVDDNGDSFGKNVCNNGCTFSAWANTIKPDSGLGTIVGRADADGDNRFFQFYIDNGEDTVFAIYENGNSTQCVVDYTGSDVINNIWYYYVGVYDNSTGTGNVSVYRNGVWKASTTCPFSGINITAWQDNEDVFIGMWDGSSFQWVFNGTIDDVMIFNRSLSADEISAIYNATKLQHTENLSDGSHSFKAYTQDLAGNMNNSGVISFTTDTTYPIINITYPSNLTNTTNTQLNVNYTRSDTNLDSCWYTRNDGATNTSLTACTNITGVTWYEGLNNITIWANDSANNRNSSSITFRLDTTAPSMNITTPKNFTNSSNELLNVNFTAIDSGVGISTCWYSNDTMTGNTTLTNCANITTMNWSDGQHNVTIWANDSLNNKNSTSVRFTVDTTNPNATLLRPINGSYNSTLSINFTANITDALGIKNATLYIYNQTGVYTGGYNAWLTFDGVNDNVNLTNNSIFVTKNQSFTIMAFAYSTNLTVGTGGRKDIITKSKAGDREYILATRDSNASNFIVWNDAGGIFTISTGATPNENEWFHIAGRTNDSQAGQVFFNGLVSGTDATTSGSREISTNSNVLIGDIVSASANETDWQGRIDEVRFYNKSLDSKQIRRIYNESDYGSGLGKSIPVLNYHKIEDSVCDVSTEVCYSNFSDQMSWLNSSGYSTITYNNYYQWRNNNFTLPKKPIILVFDDGWLSQYNNASQVLDDYGYVGVTAIITEKALNVANYMNWTQIQNLSDKGWQIVSHSFNATSIINYNSSNLLKALNGTKYEIEGNISVTPTLFIMPDNENNDTTDSECAKYYTMCSGHSTSTNTQEAFLFKRANLTHENGNPIGMRRIIISNVTTLNEMINAIDYDDGLIGYYKFNENSGTTAYDSSDYGNNGTISGATWGNELNIKFVSNTLTALFGVVVTMVDNVYKWWVQVWDWAGNTYSATNNTVTIDTTLPLINITYPANLTNTTNTQINVNYTRSDTNLGSCWYTRNAGATNTTLTGCTNITGVTWYEGLNNITIWANDSANNRNSSFVRFRLDTIVPLINITYPKNLTNTTNTQINVNYTRSDSGIGLDSCWYTRNDGATNTSLTTSCNNITGVTWYEGLNNVTIWANDSANNRNSSFVRFTLDTIIPVINITYPTNTSYSENVTNLNYTYTEINPSFCWWSNDSGDWNSTKVTCGTNWTGLNATDGGNKWTIYINDSAGNANSTSISFYKIFDITPPSINITYPYPNGTSINFNGPVNLTLNVTSNDANGVSIMWYNVDGGTNQTFINSTGIILSVLEETFKIFTINVWVNDTYNNINSTSITVTIVQLASRVGVSGGEGGNFGDITGDLYSNLSDTTYIKSITTEPEIIRICNLNSVITFRNCIINFSWIIFIMIICTLIIVTEYYQVGISRLIFRRRIKIEKEIKNDE